MSIVAIDEPLYSHTCDNASIDLVYLHNTTWLLCISMLELMLRSVMSTRSARCRCSKSQALLSTSYTYFWFNYS